MESGHHLVIAHSVVVVEKNQGVEFVTILYHNMVVGIAHGLEMQLNRGVAMSTIAQDLQVGYIMRHHSF